MTISNKKNMIILTTGSSGSSVLTGLIASQGYFLGEKTKKLDFDTFENSELVDLNIEILKMAGFPRYDCNDIPPPNIERIKKLKESTNLKPFRQFIEKCNKKKPWLWKDPRLAYTIHFWAHFKDVLEADFIFVDRDPKQSYSGLILSRKIPMSYKNQIQMNQNYLKSCANFVQDYKISFFNCLFENLILNPESFIEKLNEQFDLSINMDDLTKIYRGELYIKRYSILSFIRAKAHYFLYRYIKNDYIKFPRGPEDFKSFIGQ